MAQQLRYCAAYATRGVNASARSVEAVFSSETVDSYGDVVDQASWKLERFKRNPVALRQHRYDNVIGHVRDIAVVGGKLQGSVHFATTPLAEETLQLFADQALRAFSVGFVPGRIVYETVNGVDVQRLYDCELWEVSAVSVPANPDALVKHKAAGLLPPSYRGDGYAGFLAELDRRMAMTDEQCMKEDVDDALARAFGRPAPDSDATSEREERTAASGSRTIHEAALEDARAYERMTEDERTEHDFNEAVERAMHTSRLGQR